MHVDLWIDCQTQIKQLNLDVVAHKVSRNGIIPLYIPDRTRFNRAKHIVKSESISQMEHPITEDRKQFISAVATISAIFHDIGKNTVGFQSMLRYKGDKKTKQIIRHEFVSYIILSWITRPSGNLSTDYLFLKSLSDGSWIEHIDEFTGFITTDKDTVYDFLKNEIIWKDVFSTDHYSDDRKLIEAVKFVVLTHHIMISYNVGRSSFHPSFFESGVGNSKGAFIRGDINNPEISQEDADRLEELFRFMKTYNTSGGFLPVTSKKNTRVDVINTRFLNVISRIASSFIPFFQSHHEWKLSGGTCFDAALVARNFMIMGDNKASSLSVELPCMETKKNSIAYANTKNNTGALGDDLITHLTRVILHTHKALKAVSYIVNEIPGNEMPEIITGPSPDAYAWQNKSVEAVREFENGGFIAFVIAGTGSGKTIANMKILSAVSDNIRATTILPLMSLTSQTFDSYKDDMGLTSQQVAIVMGEQISSRMTCEAADETFLQNGSDEESIENIGQSQLKTETINDHRGLTIPDVLHVSSGGNRQALDVFLTYPVIASTADMLIPGVDLSNKRGMATYLRSVTSDLIIDELDNYSYEDQIILSRLVYQAGLMGRKVIISSATLPPELVDMLAECYKAGYEGYVEFFSIPFECSVAIISECQAKLVPIKDFNEKYNGFIADQIAQMESLPVRRRLKTFDFDGGAWHEEFLSEALFLHSQNMIPESRTSFGVIRLNRVDDVISLTRFLLNNPCVPENVRVACLHARFPKVVRNQLDKAFKEILSRKNGKSPIENEHFKKHVYNDLIVIIVTSNIVETGRDFDFDWAVSEPCSEHSLVQLAGRVRRHRPEEYLETNMSMSETSIKCKTEDHMTIENPGIDTSIKTGQNGTDDIILYPARNKAIDFRRTAENIVNLHEFEKMIDNRFLISRENKYTSLGTKYVFNTLRVAIGNIKITGLNRDNSITSDIIFNTSSTAYYRIPHARRNAYTYTKRTFRRKENEDKEYQVSGDGINLTISGRDVSVLPENMDRSFFHKDIYSIDIECGDNARIMSINRNICRNGGEYGIVTGFKSN